MAREQRRWEVDDGTTAEQKRGGRGALVVPPGLSFFKPKKAGSHTLDIVPFLTTESRNRYAEKMRFSKKVGVLYPERTFWVHYGVGVNNDSFACLARNFGKPCPICQQRATYLDDPDGESQDKADSLKPKQRQIFLVFDNDEPDKGLQLWEVSQYNFGRHIEDYIEGAPKAERSDFRTYYHPDKGMSIRVTCKEATTGANTYTDFLIYSMTPRAKPLPDSLIDHEFDLDAMVAEPEYATVKAVFLGLDEDDTPDDRDVDNGDPGSKLPMGPHRSRRPEPAPEPTEPYIPCSKDIVSFEWKGEEVEGEVVSFDKDSKLVRIKMEGRDKPVPMELSDITLVRSDDTFDLKDPPADVKARGGKQLGWGDGDDDGRTFQRKPAATAPVNDDPDPEPPKPKPKPRK